MYILRMLKFALYANAGEQIEKANPLKRVN